MGKKNGFIRNMKRIERVFKENGNMTTPEIYNALVNQKGSNGRPYRHTVTMNQLVNLLSKSKQFKKCENNGITTTLSGAEYPVARWEFLEGENEKTEPDN
jgi:hypothetical protein